MQTNFFYRGKFWIISSVIIIIVALIVLSKKIDKTVLKIEYVTVEKADDIVSIENNLVPPILYSDVKLLNELDMETRKKKFVEVILPTILIYHHQLGQEREKVKILHEKYRNEVAWSIEDSMFVQPVFQRYKTDEFEELIDRMEPPPTSLAIAQAALESGWGSSRFFKEANNVFGIWSFSENDERIVANLSRDGKAIYLKKYSNLLGSVEDYHLLLASSDHYSDFRDCIQRGNNVFELIWYLRTYSERRDQYVIMLRNVIAANQLTNYDEYILDPAYYDYPDKKPDLFNLSKQ
ncbi:MAG: hypothetical protein HC819_08245 [Cyclobacteriaceae bacterium]|nr:hypothetical protein [Cyclobacteriaceae bacterium]